MPRVPLTDFRDPKLRQPGNEDLFFGALAEHTETVRLLLNGGLVFDVNFNAQLITLPRVDIPPPLHHEVGGTDEPAFSNSWVNFDSTETTYSKVRFHRTALGLTCLLGYCKDGTINTGTTGAIFTLPSGYAPNKDIEIGTVAARAGTEVRATVYIDSTGRVRAHVVDGVGALDWLSLSGISFLAGDSQAAPEKWVATGWPLLVQSRVRNIIGVTPLWVRPLVSGEPSGLFSVDWEPTETGFRIKALPGLSPGRAYSVTLLVVGGGS